MTCRHKNQRRLPEREWLPWWWCLTERWRQSSPLTAQRWRPATSRATVTCSQHYTSSCINTGVVISTLCIICINTGVVISTLCIICINTGVVISTLCIICINTGVVISTLCIICINTGVVISTLCIICINTGVVISTLCINTGMVISTLPITVHQYRYGHFRFMQHAASTQVWSVPH